MIELPDYMIDLLEPSTIQDGAKRETERGSIRTSSSSYWGEDSLFTDIRPNQDLYTSLAPSMVHLHFSFSFPTVGCNSIYVYYFYKNHDGTSKVPERIALHNVTIRSKGIFCTKWEIKPSIKMFDHIRAENLHEHINPFWHDRIFVNSEDELIYLTEAS